jgi:hypothetical protein
MKKITIAFAAVLMVAGLSFSALADPGWGNGRRFDNHARQNRIHNPYDHRDYRDDQRSYRDDQRSYRQPVIADRVPVHPYQPVVRVYEPHTPSFSLYFPNFSIQIR